MMYIVRYLHHWPGGGDKVHFVKFLAETEVGDAV